MNKHLFGIKFTTFFSRKGTSQRYLHQVNSAEFCEKMQFTT